MPEGWGEIRISDFGFRILGAGRHSGWSERSARGWAHWPDVPGSRFADARPGSMIGLDRRPMSQRRFSHANNPGFACAESVLLLPFGQRSFLPAIEVLSGPAE